ncbi:MAG: carboxymuconolactone decarboxylase [Paucimonas sp.]|nr:carboxymuconolactone decarboxylase [Paucimonas sp.]
MLQEFPPLDPATGMPGPERMPMLPEDGMDEAQRNAAQALIAGPRGAVFGPFIPLLRSPDLMDRMQKVGEYLRFGSVLEPATAEFAILVVSRQWAQQFEWCMHYPLALQAGASQAVLDQLGQGARPQDMSPMQALVYDFCEELLRNRGIADVTYARALELLGERGVLELTALVGYFTSISMVMNVARTPPLASRKAGLLPPLPR